MNLDMKKIYSYVIAFYIISAIAFECTPSTARIATMAIYLVFVMGMIHCFNNKKITVNIQVISLVIMTLYIVCCSLVVKHSMVNTIIYLYLTCAVLCFIVYQIVKENINIVDLLLASYILGTTILSVRVAVSYGGITGLLDYALVEGERRIGGEFLNENILGLMLGNAFICCCVLGYKFRKEKLILSRVLFFLSPVYIIFLLLTGSKKAVVFLMAGVFLIFMFFVKKVKGIKKIFILFGGVFIIWLVYYMIMNFDLFYTVRLRWKEFFSTILGMGQMSHTDLVRLNMVDEGMKAFWQSPIIGNGTGYSYVLFNTYSHNNFVELLMNYGLIGFLIYYIPYGVLLVKLFRKVLEKDLYSMYFFAFILLQIVLGVGWVNYYERVIQLMTMVAWGYIDGYKEVKESSDEVI